MTGWKHVLAHYPLDWRHAEIEFLGAAGGFSGARFWRLNVGRQTLCLRRWPPGHPDRQRLACIHEVLKHVSSRGASYVAAPRETRQGSTIVEANGHLWELTPWMPGKADYHARPGPKKLAAALRTLAHFHRLAATVPRCDIQRSPSPGILHRQRCLRQWAAGDAKRLASRAAVGRATALGTLAGRLCDLFKQIAPRTTMVVDQAAEICVDRQPCIRDIWHDHVLLTGNRVTGLVDFGAMRDESVAGDVARLLGSLVSDEPTGWQQGLCAYESLRRLSAEERLLLVAFDRANVALSGLNWLRWIFEEGRQFEDQAVILRRLQWIISRMESLRDHPWTGRWFVDVR